MASYNPAPPALRIPLQKDAPATCPSEPNVSFEEKEKEKNKQKNIANEVELP